MHKLIVIKFLKQWYSILIVLVTCVWVFFNLTLYKGSGLFTYDKAGYQLYLPAIFIYEDIKDYNWYDSLVMKYSITNGLPGKFGLNRNTGFNVNTYPIGSAICNLPFFLFADLWAKCTLQYPRDGFSWGYQLYASLASIVYSFLGLLVLRKTLKPLFSIHVVHFVILVIFFGTNLYNYAVLDPGMSHPISFFLFSVLLYYLLRLRDTNQIKYSILFGLVLGLSFITRNTAILLGLFPLVAYLLDNTNKYTFRSKLINISIIGSFFLIGSLPQIAYIYLVTGKLWVNTYSGSKFNFLNPEIINGLFSFRKGLLVYTPLIILPFIGLFYTVKQKQFRSYAITLACYLVVFIYFSFSWEMWYYGWGYGCRPFIEVYALLAIPLAIILEEIVALRVFARSAVLSIIILLISLNLFQSWQYRKYILHGDSVNMKYYFRIFLKTNITDADRALIDSSMPMDSGGW
ncbi:MAG: hypothetical protein RL660_321 [Bacteroidota bacterium]|jgi:hypothetical protein